MLQYRADEIVFPGKLQCMLNDHNLIIANNLKIISTKTLTCMPQFSGLAVCSVTHLEWYDNSGKCFKGILLTPIAGKIPSKRILYTPFFPELEKSQNGEYFFMSFYETQTHEKLGRRFQWTSIPDTQSSDFPLLIKELGPALIVNVDNKSAVSINSVDSLAKEKQFYEDEIRYFKAKAYARHQERALNESNKNEGNYGNQTNGFDSNDIYIAFDGDVDSMNEFLGNH
jgi:hypothetical protein